MVVDACMKVKVLHGCYMGDKQEYDATLNKGAGHQTGVSWGSEQWKRAGSRYRIFLLFLLQTKRSQAISVTTIASASHKAKG